MKIELDIDPDEILNDMTMDGLIQALREKFKMQEREIKKYKHRCDVVGRWYDGLLDEARSDKFEEDHPYIKYADLDFGD